MGLKERLREGKGALSRGFREAAERFFRRLDMRGERHGWMAAATGAMRGFKEHGMNVYAGNFAYSAFLALVPLLLLGLAVLGFVFHSDREAMRSVVSALRDRFPQLSAAIEDTAEGTERYRGLLGLAGLAGLAWSSSRIVHSLKLGFSRVWGYPPRSTLGSRLRALPLVLLLALAGALGMSLSLAASGLLGRLSGGLGAAGTSILFALGLLGSMAVSALILALLYRLGVRAGPGWKEALIAAVIASVLLEAVSVGLSFYFNAFSGSQALLGTLGIALGILVWLYSLGVVIFLGAELAAALQRKTSATSLAGPDGGIVPESDEEEDG